EGGVGWGCMLYADLIGHWEKRNRQAIEKTNPNKLDHAALLQFAQKYGRNADVEEVRRGEGLEGDSNSTLTGGIEDLDDYFRCKIERREDIRELFVTRFYFGCEADDPINAWAFNRRANPLGARLNAIFSSDIGHFDVPDMAAVVPEAYELVEHGLMTDDDFRDFMFANAVRFWGEVNPDFFKGTVVETAAASALAQTPVQGGDRDQSRRHHRQVDPQIDLQRRGAVDARRFVDLDRDAPGVFLEDEDRVGRRERHQGRDHRPRVVREPVVLHDPVERDREERRRDHVGQQRSVAHQPAVADAHPADRKAGQRAEQQREERHHRADIEAVGELTPEVLQIPVALSQDAPEALDRRDPRPDVVGEHVALGLERDQHH